jgi:glyoxylase-like metal-dependent hydrolase (beta-lactamase superfamily II)
MTEEEGPVPEMKIDVAKVGNLQTNVWMVEGPDGTLVVIDPGDEPDTLLTAIANRKVAGILLTHGHLDHIGAADELADETGSFLYIGREEVAHIPRHRDEVRQWDMELTEPIIDFQLDDGDELELAGLHWRFLHTPGHTPGSGGYLVGDPKTGAQHYFSGDTLFYHDIGRTDFAGGDTEAMTASLEKLARELPEDCTVYPGHGPTTTKAEEAAANECWPT